MTRRQLPTRRPCVTTSVRHGGDTLHVSVGLRLDGAVAEVFACGPKVGSDALHALEDACVVASLALQHGVPVAALRKSLGADSALAAVLGVAAEEEGR